MAAEEIPLERILQVYREESRRKGLTPLEPDFWERIQAYVAGLERDLTEESQRDPNSAKAALLRDELKKVLKRREQILQYRERKIALMACSTAAGAEADTSVLTPLEARTFREFMEVLETSRQRAFGEESPPEEEGEGVEEEAAPVAEDGPSPAEEGEAATAAGNRALVRVLEDVPPFTGLDVTYRLRKEDVISLPEDVARVLLEKGKAERVQPRV